MTTEAIKAISDISRGLVSGLLDLAQPHPPPDYTKALEELKALTGAFPELAEAERAERGAPDPSELLQRHRDMLMRVVTATRSLDSARARYGDAQAPCSQRDHWDEPNAPSSRDLEKDVKRLEEVREEVLAECEGLIDPITMPTRRMTAVMKAVLDIEWFRKWYDSMIEHISKSYDRDGTNRPLAVLEVRARFDKNVAEKGVALEKALEKLIQ